MGFKFDFMKNSSKKENKAPAPAKIVREKLPPEKYWDTLVKRVYFVFYGKRMKDEDGLALWPDWSEQKRGMEAKNLKEIIRKVRINCEAKGTLWTEAVAVDELHNFLQKAYNIPWIGKHLACTVMNKFFDMINSSDYNPSLVTKIIFQWYKHFPEKPKDDARDITAAQIIVGYLKQQFIVNNLEFSDKAVMQTVDLIFRHIQQNQWWSTKTLRTCANNLQGFISELKANQKNGTAIRKEDFGSLSGQPVQSTNDTSTGFGKL